MKQYVDLIEHVYLNGVDKEDRTGTGTKSVFGYETRFSMKDGFPLNWIKKTSFHNIKTELLWFLGAHLKDEPYSNLGRTNIKFLVDRGVNIWNDWPYENYKKFYGQAGFSTEEFRKCGDNVDPGEDMMYKGDIYRIMDSKEFTKRIKDNVKFADRWGNLGPVYGKQWRDWSGYDQLMDCIDTLKTNPDDRGIIINSWNVAELHQMALRPCHVMTQFESHFNEEGKRVLNLKLTQRSVDLFLGAPYNIACYSLLLHMVAQVVGMIPGEFIHSLGDTHIYNNHIEQTKETIRRWYQEDHYELPRLKLNKNITDIDDFSSEDIKLEGYEHHSFIPAPVAV